MVASTHALPAAVICCEVHSRGFLTKSVFHMAEMAKVATADTMVSARKDAPIAGDSIMSPTNHSTWSMSLLYSLPRVLVKLALTPKTSKLQLKTMSLTYLHFGLTMNVIACLCAFAMPAKRLICKSATLSRMSVSQSVSSYRSYGTLHSFSLEIHSTPCPCCCPMHM